MEYWSDGFKEKNNYSVFTVHHSITPILPGPDLTYKARFLQTTPTRYFRNNSLFQPSRARAGHNSMGTASIDYY